MSKEKSSASDDIADGLALLTDSALEIAGFIPGVGKVLEGARIIVSMRDRLLVNKVARFLQEFSRLSDDQRKAFFSRFQSNEELERFGETVLLLLDQSDDIQKPTVIGRLFQAAALGFIDLTAARRLSAAVNRAFVDDLALLQHFENPSSDAARREFAVSLRAVGLLKIIEQDTFDGEANSYVLNTNGEQLLRYGIRGIS